MNREGAISLPAPSGQASSRWGKRALAAGLLILFLPFLAVTDIGSGVGAIHQTCQAATAGSTVQIPTSFTPSALPAGAPTLLQPAQQTFASVLSGATGLDAGVVSAWMLNEESGGAAVLREAANNNDWLNIGYTDTATYGAADKVWSNPTTAAIATAQWLAGKPSIAGYGTSSEGIRAILTTARSSPQAQIEAIQTSGWASGGETELPSLYSEITGASSTTLLTSAPVPASGLAQDTTSSTSAAAACGELPTSQPLEITQGDTATILPDGQATAPANAPPAVKALLAAGNQITDTAYLYGGAHGTPLSEIEAAYDCSSSTSYALHAAGIFKPAYSYVSGQYETWGKPGPGQWVSIYANSAHVFMEVAGIALDTSWVTKYDQSFQVTPSSPNSGPRWQPIQAVADEYAVNPGGFVQRHPAGL